MAALHFLITGRVQGVGFRYAMCAEARRLGIAGWVRNCSDGRVEAVAVGDEADLQHLTGWANHGPAGADVKHVAVATATDTQLNGADLPFRQRTTASHLRRFSRPD